MVLFSLIIPTRNRPEGLRRLLDSLSATASDLESIEAIPVIDEDDLESRRFTYSGLSFRPVIVLPGKTMGELNLAGYQAARGRYLMLLNDDVVARTPGWDVQLRRIFDSYPDGIVLAHVNDLIFRDTLCTFPLLTREFCDLAGGICRPEYRRYRIDDHIHHVFDLLHVLGHTRRIYCPQIVFQHFNTTEHATGQRQYSPDPGIEEQDHRAFEALIGERRRLAVACVERIEGPSGEETRAARLRLLETLPDSMALRRREHAQIWPPDTPLAATPAVPQSVRLPFLARARFWIWGMLAGAAARWPLLARFHIGVPRALFDPQWYLTRHRDVAIAHVDPLLHYLRTGGFQGYNPNAHFDSAWYLSNNPDVAAAGVNPLIHFVLHGAREGRDPNLFFDVRYYSRQNPEVAAKELNPLEHFLSTGLAQGRSPNASLTLAQYLGRLEPAPSPVAAIVHAPAPLSVVIPTRNRKEQLARTLDTCRRNNGGCKLEFIIVDDGSTDGTADFLRDRAATDAGFTWRSLPPGGPGKARNFGAALARYEVLLFMGDDILPADPDFFSVHARLHAEHPEDDFAALGKICWPQQPDFPITFTMDRILEDGSQFAFSRLTPGGFAHWQYFYTSNLSVKKTLVPDWMTGGFDTGFPGAALEDIEFAYRLWQSEKGLRLYYDPTSVGFHHHPYSLAAFLDRQLLVGQSLRHLLQLHPELLDQYALRHVEQALHQAPRPDDAERLRASGGAIDRIEAFARKMEAHGQLGSEPWHADLLSALFELRMHSGYASAWAGEQFNLAAARSAILGRFFCRIPRLRRIETT